MRMGRPFSLLFSQRGERGKQRTWDMFFSTHKERSGGGGRTLGVEDL